MESPLFKKCTIQDWQIVLKLGELTFRTAFESKNTKENMDIYIRQAFNPEKAKAELNNPNSTFYLVKSGDIDIGYFKINTKNAQSEPIEGGLEIERIYMLDAHQGIGIGQLMLNKIFEIARKWNYLKIWLGVWEKNEGAIRFYQRNGFKKFNMHQFLLGNDLQTDWLMVLTLNENE